MHPQQEVMVEAIQKLLTAPRFDYRAPHANRPTPAKLHKRRFHTIENADTSKTQKVYKRPLFKGYRP